MKKFITLTLGLILSVGAFADSAEKINEDSDMLIVEESLTRADQLHCDIEKSLVRLGDDSVVRYRVLSNTSGRYFDIYPEDYVFNETEEGWTLSKEVDLGKNVIGAIAPKWMYGVKKTVIQVKEGKIALLDSPKPILSIEHIDSKVGPLNFGDYEIKCELGETKFFNKDDSCPSCLSSGTDW